MGWRLLVIFGVLSGIALPCAPAAAQDGVIVDPDSAPAKEYALPLDAARQQGAGEEQRREQPVAVADDGAAPPPPPAFGRGVEPPSGATDKPKRGKKQRADRRPERAAGKPQLPLEVVAPSDRLVAVDDGGPVVAVSVAAGLAVLLAGLALAAGARRLRPRGG